jgi:hypothetical protein
LGADHGGRGTQRRRAHQRRRQRPEAERQQRRGEGDVGLDQPGGVARGQRDTHPEGDEGTDRVALAEVEVEGRLVARAREAVEVAPVIHDPVGERKPGRRVVELDEAGDGGLAGEHDRRCVDGEDNRGRDQAPGLERRRAAAKPEDEAPDRGRDDQRGRQAGGNVGERQELAGDDDRGEAEHRDQRRRQPAGSDPVDEQPATGRERQHQQREQKPGDQQVQLPPRRYNPSSSA